MHKNIQESEHFLKIFFKKMSWCNSSNLNLFIAPSFPLISTLKNIIYNESKLYNLKLCAQNCHHQNDGAFTGEVSVKMLKSIDVSSVIIGHSERRKYFNESNDILIQKVQSCFNSNLLPIFCFGETMDERKKGNFLEIIERQVSIIKPYIKDKHEIVLAYEPVWAIGTGITPLLEEIEEVHLFVKKLYPNINILYGGSLNAKNAKDILTVPHVSGALIGGASLNPTEFASIIRSAHDIC